MFILAIFGAKKGLELGSVCYNNLMISLRKIFGERTDPLREEKEASTLRERLLLAAEAKSREGLEKERRRVDEAKRAQMPRDEELREKKREKEIK